MCLWPALVASLGEPCIFPLSLSLSCTVNYQEHPRMPLGNGNCSESYPVHYTVYIICFDYKKLWNNCGWGQPASWFCLTTSLAPEPMLIEVCNVVEVVGTFIPTHLQGPFKGFYCVSAKAHCCRWIYMYPISMVSVLCREVITSSHCC
jgi:hypothetical protein